MSKIVGWGVHGYQFSKFPAKIKSREKKLLPRVERVELREIGRTSLFLAVVVELAFAHFQKKHEFRGKEFLHAMIS